MSSIDDRIVQMQFDNDQFEKGVAQTNDSLDSLKDHLQLNGATAGFAGIQNAADSMNLGSVAEGVSRISSAFSALGIIGINVLSRITQGAISLGESTLKAVVDPLIQGGKTRAIAIEQAKFQFAGLGLDIQSTMAAATKAVHDTAFTLADAATAAAQLGASEITVGHGLENTLAGIAGVAAQTGSSFSDIANIFEGIAGNGRVYGNDLLSLASRGVNATAVLAKAFGVPQAAIHDMVSNGEISFQQFSDAMNKAFGANALKSNDTFTGALANMKAALARVGADLFTPLDEAERKVFLAMKSRIDDVHAAIQPVLDLVGQLEQKLSLKIVNFLEGVNFGPLANAAPIIGDALQSIYYSATGIAEAIGKGFRQIFPPLTYDQVLNVANAFKTFVNLLAPGSKEFGQIQQTAAGFFAVLDIAYRIVSGLFKVIFDLFGVVNTGDGSFLSLTASIGGFLVKVDNAIKHGSALNDFFRGLENVLKVPIAVFKLLANGVEFLIAALEALVTQKSVDDFSKDVNSRFSGLIKVGQFFQKVWKGIEDVLNAIYLVAEPLVVLLQSVGKEIGSKIFDALKGLKFTDVLQAINTGLFGAVLLSVNGFFGNLRSIIKGNEFAFLNPLKLILSQLRLNLKAFEMNLNAKTLKEIGVAIALIAASAVALSLVNTVKLGIALNAITLMFGELLAAFAIINKISVKGELFKVASVTSALILLAIALDLLTIAVFALSKLDWNSLAKGLTGVTVLMGVMVGAIRLLGKEAPKLVPAAFGILLLAGALLLMTSAVTSLAGLSWEDLTKGLLGMAAALAIVLQVTKNIGKPEEIARIIPVAFAFILLGGAMKVLASSIKDLGNLSLEQIVKGLAGMGLALFIIAKALDTLPKNLLVSGAGLILVATSIKILAIAIGDLGKLSINALLTGLIGMAGALLILSLALDGMEGTVPGSIALVIAAGAVLVIAKAMKVFTTFSWDDIGRAFVLLAGSLILLAAAFFVFGQPELALGSVGILSAAFALAIIAPALKLLGTITWDQIGRGMTVLGAALLILAAGGVLLIPAIPGLIGLGIAIGLLGIGVLAAGIGIGVLAGGLALLGKAGPAAIDQIVPAIQAFLSQAKAMAIAAGDFIGTFADQISTKGPQLTEAFTTVLNSMLDSTGSLVPKIVEVATLIISALIDSLTVLIPQIVNSGIVILQAILQGISDHIEKIAELGYTIMVNFLTALANKLPDIITAAGNVVLSFINGLGDYIRTHNGDFVSAGSKLFRAIVDGVSAAIERGGSDLRYAGSKIGNALLQGAKNALGINSPSKKFRDEVMPSVFEGIEKGNLKNLSRASDAGSAIGDNMVSAVQKSISDISDAVNTNIDSQPTIAPVLDLSAIKKDATQINGLLGTPTLSVDNLKVNSASANAGFEQNMRVQTDADGQPVPGTQINYTQNNYSPKALSPIDVYRGTKSQLATAKGELDKK